jgi:hypothetical protein
MIVVLIIGIVYALVLGRMNPKQHMKIVNLESLRDILIQHHKPGERLDLVLYDKCKKIALFVNDELQEEMKVDINPSLFSDTEVFKSDPFGHERKIDFMPRVIDDKLVPVCFQYTIFPNGSGSNFIIKKKNRFYIFPPYFEDVNVTDSMDEALAYFTHEKEKRISSYE